MRFQALQRLGHKVEGIDTTARVHGAQRLAYGLLRRAGCTPDWTAINKSLLSAVFAQSPDLVWIDKGLTISPATLNTIRTKSSRTRLIHYSPDDMSGRHNRSWRYAKGVPLYHLHVTTKSFCVSELKKEGAHDVLFLNNAFCPITHVPAKISAAERAQFGGPVGFVGAFEAERAEAIWYLVSHGMPVRVWGPGWNKWARTHQHSLLQVEKRSVMGTEYAKTIQAFNVNLGFLRKLNRDVQTTRSVEIPACGGFLLAERTKEHQQLFEEGVEAEFFGGAGELLQKCKYYIDNGPKRQQIASAGHRRCLTSNYSYDQHVSTIISRVTAN